MHLMLRVKPRLTYNGITVVLSNPSRFDTASLLTATGGRLFNNFLQPEYNIGACDIRLKDDNSPLIDNTRCILALGQAAMRQWIPKYSDNTIGEVRGLASKIKFDIPILSSFFPQDAADVKDYETEKNPLHVEESDDEDDEDDYGSDKKRHGRTKRTNYRFWLQQDVNKVKHILSYGIPKRPFEPEYIIYPSSELAIKILRETKNEFLYFDMETDYELNMLCFSFNFSNSEKVFVIPCLDYNYHWAYNNLHRILQALVVAMRDNTFVAHNGSAFDFFVLPFKYRLPLGKRLYDTMLAQHRCYPEAEKSLGHSMSMWAWQEEFHKDEMAGYNTVEQCRGTWYYCGKDVFGMRLCHMGIQEYARRRPDIGASIEQANASIRPYLITTLQGIEYDESILLDTIKENDRLMMQYLRCIRLLIGEKYLDEIRGKGKSSMPGSNPQCVKYFHDMLGYAVVAKGKERKDGTRGPSLGKKAIFKLRLKYENPVLDFVIAYREVAKESGSLKFTPWEGIKIS